MSDQEISALADLLIPNIAPSVASEVKGELAKFVVTEVHKEMRDFAPKLAKAIVRIVPGLLKAIEQHHEPQRDEQAWEPSVKVNMDASGRYDTAKGKDEQGDGKDDTQDMESKKGMSTVDADNLKKNEESNGGTGNDDADVNVSPHSPEMKDAAMVLEKLRLG